MPSAPRTRALASRAARISYDLRCARLAGCHAAASEGRWGGAVDGRGGSILCSPTEIKCVDPRDSSTLPATSLARRHARSPLGTRMSIGCVCACTCRAMYPRSTGAGLPRKVRPRECSLLPKVAAAAQLMGHCIPVRAGADPWLGPGPNWAACWRAISPAVSWPATRPPGSW
jgi:hypothetical protein